MDPAHGRQEVEPAAPADLHHCTRRVLHYFWKVKLDATSPLYYAAILGILLAARVWAVGHYKADVLAESRTRPRRASGLTARRGARAASAHGSPPTVAMLARSPFVPGKTRLTHGLPPDTAAALRTALLLDAMEAALPSGWPLHVSLDPRPPRRDRRSVGSGPRFSPARSTGVDSISRARVTSGWDRRAATHLDGGHDAVVLTGFDMPDLPAEPSATPLPRCTSAMR